MKPTLLDRLKPEYKAIINDSPLQYTRESLLMSLKESYNILQLNLFDALNLRDILKLENFEIHTLDKLFNEPEKV